MGFLLKGKQDEFSWEDSLWWRVLKLAGDRGWFPEGTESPVDFNESQPWGGSYVLKEGQMVADEDAKELASALKKALEVVSDEVSAVPKVADESNFEEYQKYLGIPVALFFSGRENKENLAKFIEFCSRGSFRIF